MSKPKMQDKGKMSEIDEQIFKIFDIKKRLGKGAYGIVWKAIDKKTQQTVAVKKIFDAFRNETDAQRTFREIMFLRAFRNHENIIQLHSIHRAANHMDIYLSFEFMESDLHNVIKRGSILKDVHKRYVMYQLLNATKFIHSGNVIHRDLKPSNILIDSRCRCKIADFGLARSVSQRPQHENDHESESNEQILTDYVATRWYRAPEILVASKNYTKGIDMWSLGCILAEMIRGKPLFPGSCTVNQVERIVSALPEVTQSDIKNVGAGFGCALLNQNSANNNIKLNDLLTGSPDDARDLVKSLLILDPTQRLNAKQALEHRYIEKFRNVLPEPELSSDIIPPFRDDIQLSVQEYRSKLYELISSAERNGFTAKPVTKKRDLPGSHSKIDSNLSNDIKTNKSKSKYHNNYEDSLNGNQKNIASYSESIIKKYEKKTPNYQYNRAPITTTTNPTTTSNSNNKVTKVLKNYTRDSSIENDKSRMPKIKPHVNGTFSVLENNTINDSIKSQNKLATQSMLNGSTDYKLLRRSSMDSNATSGYYSNDKKSRTSLDSKNYVNSKYSNRNSSTTTPNKITTISGESNYFTSANNPKLGSSLKYNRHRSLDIEDKNLKDSQLIHKKRNSFTMQRQLSSDEKSSSQLSEPIISNGELSTQIYYENRLKSLEDKIKKHKNDMKTFLNDNPKLKVKSDSIERKSKITSDQKLFKNYGRGDSTRSFSDSNNRSDHIKSTVKYDLTYAEGDCGNLKQNQRGSNYGIITASDLFKLRSTEMIL